MGKYVLGVDGGGTKTHCAIFDMEMKMVDFLEWGTTSHECLKGGYEELREELKSMLTHVLDRNGINVVDLVKCVFGMSGIDHKGQHEVVSGIIRDLGITDFILCNDSYIGIKAGSPTGYGICVINGTGCSVTGINKKGDMFQIGGLGDFSDDPAGGGFLGTAAIKSAYNYLFRNGKYTKILNLLYKVAGTDCREDFMEFLVNKINKSPDLLNKLNSVVFEAANEGDEVAIKILKDAGVGLGISVNSIIKELDFEKTEILNVILAGSVNVKGEHPALVNALMKEVTSKNPDIDIQFIKLYKPPVCGAVIWAFSHICEDPDLFKKVTRQF